MQNHSEKNSDSENIRSLKKRLDGMNEFNFDETVLNTYLAAIADRPSQSVVPDPAKAWETFRAAHKEIFPPEEPEETTPSLPAAPPQKPKGHRRLRKMLVVMVAAVAAMTAFCTMASGSSVGQRIVTWDDGTLYLFNTYPGADDSEQQALIEKRASSSLERHMAAAYRLMTTVQFYMPAEMTVQDVMAECGVTEALMPTWVPDGFAQQPVQVTIDPIHESIDFDVNYIKEEGKTEFAASVSAVLPNGCIHVEKDGREPISYEAGGQIYYIVHNLNRITAITRIDDQDIAFWGDVSVDEMEKIIDSVYKKGKY